MTGKAVKINGRYKIKHKIFLRSSITLARTKKKCFTTDRWKPCGIDLRESSALCAKWSERQITPNRAYEILGFLTYLKYFMTYEIVQGCVDFWNFQRTFKVLQDVLRIQRICEIFEELSKDFSRNCTILLGDSYWVFLDFAIFEILKTLGNFGI